MLPKELMPRERLIRDGAGSLSDIELLAIFLRTGFSGVNVLQLSAQLLKEFGSLRALISASKEDFCQVKGLGEAKFVQLQASLEISRRHLLSQLQQGVSMNSPQVVKDFLMSELRDRHREAFYVLYLNNQNQLLYQGVLFEGTINQAAVYPREIVKLALDYHAASVILAHNHPSGTPEPSSSDRHITTQIEKALETISVKVLDHVIIGDGCSVSFAERGWL